MAKKRVYTQDDLAAAREFLDSLPSLKVDKFERFGPEATIRDQLYAALHDEEFTLTDILRFLEKHGFSSTVDKLRTMRRVMFTLSIDQPETDDPSRYIDISRMRVHSWIAKRKSR
ncbi:hypothetical protein ALO80_200146 [Pseudomonas caricapapayae]|uniref:Uncharacterized protein n=1 Tax=Pseudomonas caricapapayae TaxID=46678 RepID=A0A0P9KP40_9PSED|nr:hypothetical protein [Pseudomonas caricapapayae]KPW63219.1 hypothetical protein ALO80_200146 [Pseudomonas caricapapayae]RMM06929.1 hypothetical protein ALQ84_200046 [Pseudomonas caricapapayae]RMV93493.1 hypothetical protein ALP01_200126 [Pseudomonas caricapapayae]